MEKIDWFAIDVSSGDFHQSICPNITLQTTFFLVPNQYPVSFPNLKEVDFKKLIFSFYLVSFIE